MNSRKKRRDLYKAKQMHWEDVWELPLSSDEYPYSFSANRVMAITFERTVSKRDAKRIIAIINGEAEPSGGLRYCGRFHNIHVEGNALDMYGPLVMSIRGWGHLTGGGGLRLPTREAERVQDEFRDFILQRLNR